MPDEGRLGKPCEGASVAFLEAPILVPEAPDRTVDTPISTPKDVGNPLKSGVGTHQCAHAGVCAPPSTHRTSERISSG